VPYPPARLHQGDESEAGRSRLASLRLTEFRHY
jgi:hypothetical protein